MQHYQAALMTVVIQYCNRCHHDEAVIIWQEQCRLLQTAYTKCIYMVPKDETWESITLALEVELANAASLHVLEGRTILHATLGEGTVLQCTAGDSTQNQVKFSRNVTNCAEVGP